MLRPAIRGAVDAECNSYDLDSRLAALERSVIREALDTVGGSRRAAARLLGISRNGLAAKMARHGMAAEDQEN